MRKILVSTFVLAFVLALGVAGCGQSQQAATSDDKSDEAVVAVQEAEDDAQAEGDAQDEEAAAPESEAAASNAVTASADQMTFDDYLALRPMLDAASTTTSTYGDSDPHNSIHASAFECGTCHVNEMGGGEVQESFACNNCHAWPRELQSKL